MRILLLILSIQFMACTARKEVAKTDQKTSLKAKEVRVEMGFDKKTDAYSIEEAFVEGPDLHLKVSYTGGCEDHVFELFTDGLIMKSLPPKQRFFLKHHAQEDSCETVITENLVFSLEGVTTSGNTLVILLKGYKGDLTVEF